MTSITDAKEYYPLVYSVVLILLLTSLTVLPISQEYLVAFDILS